MNCYLLFSQFCWPGRDPTMELIAPTSGKGESKNSTWLCWYEIYNALPLLFSLLFLIFPYSKLKQKANITLILVIYIHILN